MQDQQTSACRSCQAHHLCFITSKLKMIFTLMNDYKAKEKQYLWHVEFKFQCPQMKFSCNTAVLIYLRITYGCFHTMAELSSCNKHHMAHKAQHNYYLVLSWRTFWQHKFLCFIKKSFISLKSRPILRMNLISTSRKCVSSHLKCLLLQNLLKLYVCAHTISQWFPPRYSPNRNTYAN